LSSVQIAKCSELVEVGDVSYLHVQAIVDDGVGVGVGVVR
jgi:hypothetical protein